MRSLDTDAMSFVARALGVGAPMTATRDVVFDDDVLQQSLDVGPLLRRARLYSPMSAKIWRFAIQMSVGAGGGTDNNNLRVYTEDAGTFEFENDYPEEIDRQAFDAWVSHVSCFVSAESGDFTSASFNLIGTPPGSELGPTNTSATAPTNQMPLACWDGVATVAGIDFAVANSDVRTVVQLQSPLRVRGGNNDLLLNGRLTAAAGTGATTASVQGLITIAPAGMGQDLGA